MILLLSGTSDGIELIKLLNPTGKKYIVSSATDYGTRLAMEAGAERAITGILDFNGLIVLAAEERIDTIIDASHPFATEISQNAINASKKIGIKYIRYQRPETSLPKHDKIHFVRNFQEGGIMASELGNRVFYTGGSNNFEEFLLNCTAKKVYIRVLPVPDIIKKCIELGLMMEDIIAMKGPFSKSLNKEMFREYQADVLVTKDSGQAGGTPEKVLGALENNMEIVVIERPIIDYPFVTSDIKEIIRLVTES